MKSTEIYGISSLDEASDICKRLNQLIEDNKLHPLHMQFDKRVLRYEPRGYRFDATHRVGQEMSIIEWGIWPIWAYKSQYVQGEFGGPFVTLADAEHYLQQIVLVQGS